jgi:hypothetical protein
MMQERASTTSSADGQGKNPDAHLGQNCGAKRIELLVGKIF